MSRGTIIAFRNNEANNALELRNSWLGAAWIWSHVFNEYVKDPNRPYDTWMIGGRDKELWNTAYNPEIPEYIRAVMASTFDYALIKQENFDKYIGHLKEFCEHYQPQSAGPRYQELEHSSHLMSWVQFIEQNRDAQAIGFHATSVTENLWVSYNEETDTEVLYNIATGDEHFEVYELLNEEKE